MEQIPAIVALVGDVLGPDAAGMYLHGSSVLGGLKPASDVDVLVVSRRPVDSPERRALLDGLLEISGSGSAGEARPVELTMALAGDHALTGPPPARVLDPVPHADLVRSSVAGTPGLLDDPDSDTRNVVLTLARIWTTLATCEIRSKDAAADWALARLPPERRPVLAHARELYLSRRYSEESWSPQVRAQVRPHVDAVLVEIHRLLR